MKKIIHLTVFLTIVSALAGAILAYVNDITNPIIQEKKIAAVKATLEEIFPNAEGFTEVTFEDASGTIVNAYEATGAGFAFNVEVQGYKDVIDFMVGFDTDGKVVGFTVNYVNDTPGLGSRVADQEFKDVVIGKQVGGSFDTLAGATVTSSAVVRGIEAAGAVFETLK